MLSFVRSRCGYLANVYRHDVKCMHRPAGRRIRGRQRPRVELSNRELMANEGLVDLEDVEDIHDWFEDNMKKPNFVRKVASEEEKWKKKVEFKMIERKYFKKPQEISLLTWDAKEQIRFLHNEYPDEWTVDRLAESFPISREGVALLLKSRFVPKSLNEIVKHDERVQKRWKELNDGKANGMLDGGPVMLRYKELLKNAAGNPSLPAPDLERLLLDPGSVKRQQTKTAGTFLSIVKDYCERKQLESGNAVPKDARPARTEFGEHVAQNRRLIEGVVGKTDKTRLIEGVVGKTDETRDGKRPRNAQPTKRSDMVDGHSLRERRNAGDGIEKRLPVRRRNEEYSSSASGEESRESIYLQRLIDSDFEFSARDGESRDGDFRTSESRGRLQRGGRERPVRAAVVEVEEPKSERMTDAGLKGTKKLLTSKEEVNKKLDANESLARGLRNSSSRPLVDLKVQEAVRRMSNEESENTYIYSPETGYQHPFGRKEDLPVERISVPRKLSRPGTEFRRGNDVYDENGEFLYRTP